MICIDRPIGRLMDQEALSYLLKRSPRTIRQYCPPVGKQGRSLLYNAEQCALILETIPKRTRRRNEAA